jgi:hypothetical protein
MNYEEQYYEQFYFFIVIEKINCAKYTQRQKEEMVDSDTIVYNALWSQKLGQWAKN